jgi:hypothetical protein
MAIFDENSIVEVFQVRSSPPPALEPGDRVSEGVADRYLNPRARSLAANGSIWGIRFSDNDHRLDSLETGTEIRLEELVRQRILSIGGQDHVWLATDRSLISLDRNYRPERRQALGCNASRATIGYGVAAFDCGDRIDFHDLKTLKRLATMKADRLDSQVVDAIFPPQREQGHPNSSALLYTTGNREVALAVRTPEKQWLNWTFDPDNAGNVTNITKSVWWDPNLHDLTASWSSQVFLAAKDLLIYAAGSLKDDTVLIQFDAGNQQRSAVFLPPNGGWTGKERNSIVDGIQINDEIVLILGSQQNSPVEGNLWVGIWPASGGKPKFWHKLGTQELNYRGLHVVDDSSRVQVFAQETTGSLKAFAGSTGQSLWSSKAEAKYGNEIETFASLEAPPPLLVKKSGTWQLSGLDHYRDICFRLLTGGGDRGELTTVQLPERERQRINKMVEWVRSKR